MTASHQGNFRRLSDGQSGFNQEVDVAQLGDSTRFLTRARERDKDRRRRARLLFGGIGRQSEDWLVVGCCFVGIGNARLLARYDVRFSRTPHNERCVFCNARYLGEAKIGLPGVKYTVRNHVWLVDFLRANNIDYSEPLPGLLTIWSVKWHNAGLGDPGTAFAGLCAINADRRRSILAIECKLEDRL